MTPLLNDLDYLAELTTCLTHALARLVQLRPSDPITFLETSLRQHRRLHPRENQGREVCSPSQSINNSAVASPTPPPAGFAPPSLAREGVTAGKGDALRDTTVNPVALVRCEEDFIADEYINLDSVDPSQVLHKHSRLDFQTIGDLFDDDDFG
ncbi:hypothetical protein EGW08_021577 [Elysia chlorotica]|uniref:Uncharacterized protein n=1 Tax=Elysia chlorotica TaxID=188477 RepID=A0A3S1AS91_ELYCH|nr:hypothetical protein EGW08_021577 [Elysia chlorotica]